MLFMKRSEKVERLRKVPLFSGLSLKHLNTIAGLADETEVKSGKVLGRQGKLEPQFVLIVEGNARVERDGKILAHLKAGDFAGEMSLIDGQPRSATVIAESPCSLLVIDARSFGELLETVPGLQRKMLLTLSQRLRDADAALAAVN